MADRSDIIQRLEDKVAAALRDHNLTAAAGGTPVAQSAMAEYNRLVQDTSSSTGIKYLALHSVAVKQGFYVDKRDQQEMLGTVAQEMGNLSPAEVLAGIQYLKSHYPAIYQCDVAAIDRMESNAKEFMKRLPIDQQDRTVAEAKNVQLNARPITSGASEAIEPAPMKIPVATPLPFIPFPLPVEPTPIPIAQVYAPQSTQTYTPPAAETYISPQTQLPTQNNSNKSALIIGGSMIVGAILFSSILLSQQPKTSTDTSSANNPQKPADKISSISNNQSEPLRTQPHTAVIEHYQLIQVKDLDKSWTNLSTSFQGSNLTKGLQEYKTWWDSVDRINIGRVEVINRTIDKATIKAELSYLLKSGRTMNDQKKYIYLFWDNDRWLINEKSDVLKKW